MERKNELQNFTYFNKDSSEYIIRNDLVDVLAEDLRNDFSDSASLRDVKIFEGRKEHFSYQPKLSNERLFVRNARRGGLMSFLGNLYLHKGRPLEELRISEALRAMNIDTPEIVAVRIQRTLSLFYKYTVVLKEIQNAEDLHSYLSKNNSDKRYVIENVASALAKLHQSCIFHSDLNLKNILLVKENGKLKIYFADLDKSWGTTYLRNSKRIKNIARLYRSCEKMLSKENELTLIDKVRFLKAYGVVKGDVKCAMAMCRTGLWFHRIIWTLKSL